uniref:Uncharacterized protein n=1 Tax=Setaria viridis TaxID=4556 RepID=A0A4U6T6U0_SETVI|nr:hypothetical protein SEVIR_9G429550v2 [Setaria viridis]
MFLFFDLILFTSYLPPCSSFLPLSIPLELCSGI